jgi:hypothetical protein
MPPLCQVQTKTCIMIEPSDWSHVFRETLCTNVEHCSALFLGLTVQPCGEPCGSAAGFDFLTVQVIEIEKKSYFRQCLNLCQWLEPGSMIGRFRFRISYSAAKQK